MSARELAVAAATIAVCATACAPPSVATSEDAPLVVTVRASDGAMLIDGQLVDAASVRQHAGTERRVFIRGDGKVTYAQFMAAMKQLEGLNIPVLIGQKGPVQ